MPDTMKLLGRNIGEILQNIEISKGFLDKIPKIQDIKAKRDKWIISN